LRGGRIAWLDNGKPNAAALLDRLAHSVAARTGLVVEEPAAKAHAAGPCDGDTLAKLRLRADVILTGSGD
jgi:hypothetical protein